MSTLTIDPDEGHAPHRAPRPGLKIRIFHCYFLLRRPMTLGVRGMVYDRAARTVLLVRHTYLPGWQFPGGGVEVGEVMGESLARELREEANIEIEGTPALRSMHLNRQASRRDHVAFYVVETYRQTGPRQPDREIAEAGFFRLDALPPDTTPATRRRIAEVIEGVPPSPLW